MLLFLFVCFYVLSPTSLAISASSSIYHYVNDGMLSVNAGEFGSAFRLVDGSRSSKFGLYFYCDQNGSNYTLAVGMGFPPRWVWAANRNNPIDDGATLTLRSDGNLILADEGGRTVWQTNTANKGVIGMKLRDNGNLVLHDAKNKLLWQSFDHPTDTLLPGQPLQATHKLVSRASLDSSLEGKYSLVMRSIRVSMYFKSQSTLQQVPYYTLFTADNPSTFKKLRFAIQDADDHYSRLTLEYSLGNGEGYSSHVLTETKYNSAWSFLRLDYDGNLRVYTYYDKLREGLWTTEFTLFARDSPSGMHETECQLPERCGNFGVCIQDQCVACPSSKGLLGWRKSCSPPKLVQCSEGKNVKYYKIEGVEHFSSKYSKGDGPIDQFECEIKCTRDCKCLGYFYHEDSSRCWVAYDLKTLTQSGNIEHVAYVKIAN